MTYRLRITEEAESDMEEAAHWYDQQHQNLGDRFLDEIYQAFEIVLERPLAYPRTKGEARRILTRRFPYSICYLIDGNDIVIMAVVHSSRAPVAWEERLP